MSFSRKGYRTSVSRRCSPAANGKALEFVLKFVLQFVLEFALEFAPEFVLEFVLGFVLEFVLKNSCARQAEVFYEACTHMLFMIFGVVNMQVYRNQHQSLALCLCARL